MKRANQKGFTLIELLAAIGIIMLLGLVAVPGVMNAINNGREGSYNITIDNIKTASIEMFEEIEFTGGNLVYDYTKTGAGSSLTIHSNSLTFHLQTLVSNGYLKGETNTDSTTNLKKVLKISSKDKNQNNKYIGDCQITVTKAKDSSTNKITYSFTSLSNDGVCPKTENYN